MNAESLYVVKIGGAVGVDATPVLDELPNLVEQGRRVVLVHGGSGETDRLSRDVGMEPRALTSPSGHVSRHTDPRTLELFVMATALVNRRFVGALNARGLSAVGLSGLDGSTLRGRRKSAIRTVEQGRVRIVRDDWSGRVESVNTALLDTLISTGHVPVLAPIAMTAEGQCLNVDGDRVAAEIAGALHAEALVLLTEAPGLLERFPDPATRIERATSDELPRLMEFAQGRMKRKVLAAGEALERGARTSIIASANDHEPIRRALSGAGTTIVSQYDEVSVR